VSWRWTGFPINTGQFYPSNSPTPYSPFVAVSLYAHYLFICPKLFISTTTFIVLNPFSRNQFITMSSTITASTDAVSTRVPQLPLFVQTVPWVMSAPHKRRRLGEDDDGRWKTVAQEILKPWVFRELLTVAEEFDSVRPLSILARCVS
jgi:hypothetical protein